MKAAIVDVACVDWFTLAPRLLKWHHHRRAVGTLSATRRPEMALGGCSLVTDTGLRQARGRRGLTLFSGDWLPKSTSAQQEGERLRRMVATWLL